MRPQLHPDVEHHQHADHDAHEEVHDFEEPGRRGDVEAGQSVLDARHQRPPGQQREQPTGDDRGRLHVHVGQRQRDPDRGGRHRGDRELVELRQPAPRAQPRQPVAEHRAQHGRDEHEQVTADQHGGRPREQPARRGEHPGRIGVPVAADLREPPVGVLQGDGRLGVAEVVHELEHGREARVVGAASPYGPGGRHGIVHERRLVGDRQQGEGDVRLAAVQPVGPADGEHRRLHVLRALTAREQQLADTQGQVEHARDGRTGIVLGLVHRLRRGPLGHRHAQHRAHPVLPGHVLGEADHRYAGRRGERGRRVLRAVGAGRTERRPLGLRGRRLRDVQPLRQRELGRGLRLAADGSRHGEPVGNGELGRDLGVVETPRLVRLRLAVLRLRHSVTLPERHIP